MTDEQKQDQDQTPIAKPLPTQKVKVKRVRKIGVFTILFLVLIVVILMIVTPLYSVIYSHLPQNIKESLLSGFYQKHVLVDGIETLKEPKKYVLDTPIRVLGDNTGLCFSFPSIIEAPDNQYIDAGRLNDAKRGKKIAEIIVVGDTKYEYQLNQVTINQDHKNETSPHSTICQIFGREYGINPPNVKYIYVRPIKEFTADQVFWATTKDAYQD